MVADCENHALCRVSKTGEVSTLAGNGESGFADGQGDAARFHCPEGVALAANDEIVVVDTFSHAIRVVTPGGAVRKLAGNGEAGFADGQGAASRFNCPVGLSRYENGSILVADSGNHAVRRVTMEGQVSTVAGNREAGYADGWRARLCASVGPLTWWWTGRARSWWRTTPTGACGRLWGGR